MAKAKPAPAKVAVTNSDAKCRIDKWLWAARFFKTRALATDAANKGHVKLNGALSKPSREVRIGDQVELVVQRSTWTVNVLGLSSIRGSAPIAQALYAETTASKTTREAAAAAMCLAPEPAQTISQGRPTKRDRRDLQKTTGTDSGWGDRWSAGLDD